MSIRPLLSLLLGAVACAVLVMGRPAFCAQAIVIRDCEGVPRQPLELAGKKAAVLIFIARECPISNALAPEMNRIIAAYTNFAFYLVHADPDTQAAEARQHAHDFGFQAPVLLDPEHRLVKLAGASKTPEAIMLNADGRVLYRGRINDLFANLGKKRAQPTRQDLREALDAITRGKAVPNAETKVVGCSIPDLGK